MSGSPQGGVNAFRPARTARARSLTAVATALLAFGMVGFAAPAIAQRVSAAAVDIDVEPEYRIGPGDELSVGFPYNAELNHAGPVGPDGRFTLPQVGNILIANMTVSQATATIAAELRRAGLVDNARPSLTITQYGASVFVGGEVRQPGIVKLTGGMDAFRAIIVAGGLLDTAKSKRIVVIRRGPDGGTAMSYVNLRDYLRHGPGADVGPLHAQDIIFVPKSSIAEVNLWVDQYINKVLPFSRSLNYSAGGTAVNTVAGR